jgi:endonuclease/exonuclease/phosphatase family metal-dependent hydrolase
MINGARTRLPRIQRSGEDIDTPSNRWITAAFRLASCLTDPVCHCHERFRRIAVVDALYPNAGRGANRVRKFRLLAELCGYAALAMLVTAPGIGLRHLASRLQRTPYLHRKSAGREKILPAARVFSILSWNVCCVGGGYAISDGGVMPWSARIEAIARTIIRQSADVVCLYEVFDSHAAFYLTDELMEAGYVHCYHNIGPRGLGVNSGIMVASRYEIRKPEFTPFPVETLVGRTKSAAKGVFAFDLHSDGEGFARVYATHLQHSEECMYPTREEEGGRAAQMQIVVDGVRAGSDTCTVVTGDLNLDDDEYRASPWRHLFQKGDRYQDPSRTWGGDAFCANLVGKRVSGPLNLDHTMLVAGTGRGIETSLVDPGYNAWRFTAGALSDHGALLSRIFV